MPTGTGQAPGPAERRQRTLFLLDLVKWFGLADLRPGRRRGAADGPQARELTHAAGRSRSPSGRSRARAASTVAATPTSAYAARTSSGPPIPARPK